MCSLFEPPESAPTLVQSEIQCLLERFSRFVSFVDKDYGMVRCLQQERIQAPDPVQRLTQNINKFRSHLCRDDPGSRRFSHPRQSHNQGMIEFAMVLLDTIQGDDDLLFDRWLIRELIVVLAKPAVIMSSRTVFKIRGLISATGRDRARPFRNRRAARIEWISEVGWLCFTYRRLACSR